MPDPSTKATEDQALVVIDLIHKGRSITEACKDVGVHRFAFYDACYTSDELQEKKDRAMAYAHKLRAEEAMEIKWEAYRQIADSPKYATLVIWMDKTAFGVRETSEPDQAQKKPIRLLDFGDDDAVPDA